jgi:nitrite reductase/ring-hydroxylating ferredoxin subunit
LNARPWNCTLDSILSQGAYLVVSRFGTQEQVLSRTHTLLREAIGSLQGSSARRRIEKSGFRVLHEVLPAAQIGALRDLVMPQIRPELLSLACEIGRKLFHIEGEFFIDDYTILRINYPYLAAMQAPETAENPGIGRVAEQTRQHGKANRVVDPVYDPRSYHHNEPPPAWAHGPHQDTWTGHSRLGVNLWWAIEDVPEDASMVFYPETFGRRLEPDPRSLYLKAGQPLPKPTSMALRCGEMLVFNPEMLHGTHLNTSACTRLALSSRLNPRRPRFDPNCFYAREFWHSSSNIEAGLFDRVVHFARAENLDTDTRTGHDFRTGTQLPDPAPVASQPDVMTPAGRTVNDGWLEICPGARICPGTKALVRLDADTHVLLVRGEDRLHAVEAQCPHLNIPLADGFHDDESIWCPAHAVAFSLTSGKSSCQSFSLKTYAVREERETVWLRSTQDGEAQAAEVSAARTFAIHPLKSRPRLTVNILTRDSQDRLERLLSEISNYSDQVLVGVDAASVDGTLEIAKGHADLVYQFSHPGHLAAARMLPFEYATGDWILSLDDDESFEPSFDALVPSLLAQRYVTHYWFPRKWIVSLDPCERLDGPHWFPDWQLRLFRNDRTLVWKPARPHSGYRVQGPGCREARASILHFEPLLCGAEVRQRKRKTYLEMGADPRADEQFNIGPDAPRVKAGDCLRRHGMPRARAAQRIVTGTVHAFTAPAAPWLATIMRVDMPETARAGERFVAEVHARNSGAVAWAPFFGDRSANIQLGYHLLDGDGRLIQWDTPRCPVLIFVPPGETALFLYRINAPAPAGRYLLEFDLVCEGEAWFSAGGSSVLRMPLEIVD